jgi:valyl-tRNA synthetase
VVSTTRPETMLGDTAVAVHPLDSRFKSLIGEHVWHPFREQRIPVICDDFVDPDLGTGEYDCGYVTSILLNRLHVDLPYVIAGYSIR